MKKIIKLIVPALALGLFAAIPAPVKADEAPAATQPAAKATGTISIRVVDSDGKPVAGANITITAAAAKGKKNKDPNAVKEKPASVASGITDEKGLLTLTSIPEGSYRAQAKIKGGGTGKEDVVVTLVAPGADAAAANPPVTITIQPKAAKAAKGGAAAPAPAAN